MLLQPHFDLEKMSSTNFTHLISRNSALVTIDISCFQLMCHFCSPSLIASLPTIPCIWSYCQFVLVPLFSLPAHLNLSSNLEYQLFKQPLVCHLKKKKKKLLTLFWLFFFPLSYSFSSLYLLSSQWRKIVNMNKKLMARFCSLRELLITCILTPFSFKSHKIFFRL